MFSHKSLRNYLVCMWLFGHFGYSFSSHLKTNRLFGYTVTLSLEINLLSPYRIFPILQLVSYFQHSSTIIFFYLISHFVSTVAPSDTSKWFRSRHILVLCSCYILRKLQTCAHYTVGIFQKVLLNNISMLNKELIWTNAHWPISFFPPHTSEYETICQMQFSFIREQKDPATEVYQPWSTAKGCSCTAIFLETQRTMCLFNYVVLEAHNI